MVDTLFLHLWSLESPDDAYLKFPMSIYEHAGDHDKAPDLLWFHIVRKPARACNQSPSVLSTLRLVYEFLTEMLADSFASNAACMLQLRIHIGDAASSLP